MNGTFSKKARLAEQPFGYGRKNRKSKKGKKKKTRTKLIWKGGYTKTMPNNVRWQKKPPQNKWGKRQKGGRPNWED